MSRFLRLNVSECNLTDRFDPKWPLVTKLSNCKDVQNCTFERFDLSRRIQIGSIRRASSNHNRNKCNGTNWHRKPWRTSWTSCPTENNIDIQTRLLGIRWGLWLILIFLSEINVILQNKIVYSKIRNKRNSTTNYLRMSPILLLFWTLEYLLKVDLK